MTLDRVAEIAELTLQNMEKRLAKTRDQILRESEESLRPHKAVMDWVRAQNKLKT